MFLNSLFPYANAAVDPTAFGNVVDPIITAVVYPVVELMLMVALIVFIYGIVKMIINGDDAEARKEGRQVMLYGVIGLFIMLSAWGIVYVIANSITQAVK